MVQLCNITDTLCQTPGYSAMCTAWSAWGYPHAPIKDWMPKWRYVRAIAEKEAKQFNPEKDNHWVDCRACAILGGTTLCSPNSTHGGYNPDIGCPPAWMGPPPPARCPATRKSPEGDTPRHPEGDSPRHAFPSPASTQSEVRVQSATPPPPPPPPPPPRRRAQWGRSPQSSRHVPLKQWGRSATRGFDGSLSEPVDPLYCLVALAVGVGVGVGIKKAGWV